MLLACPSCETAFRVEPEALGPSGRNVRCARCRSIWFAASAPVAEEVAGPPSAELYVFPGVTAKAGPADDVIWEASPAADAEQVPPSDVDSSLEAPVQAPSGSARRNLSWRGRDPKPNGGPVLKLVTFAFAGIMIAALAAPAMAVRILPDLAGLYASAGVRVNLRGLEFRELRTTRETHDGIALLVTEGRIANISGRQLELPLIRLAALGSNGQELYAWTAPAGRAALAEGETVQFRSRLASPPREARQVLVRFVTREEQAWSYR